MGTPSLSGSTMDRRRLYASDAERQRAYRRRSSATQPTTAATSPMQRRRQPSRPARLASLQRAVEDLKGEYEAWLESLPEPLRDGTLAERLAETVEQLDSVVELLAEVQLPKDYGRD